MEFRGFLLEAGFGLISLMFMWGKNGLVGYIFDLCFIFFFINKNWNGFISISGSIRKHDAYKAHINNHLQFLLCRLSHFSEGNSTPDLQ